MALAATVLPSAARPGEPLFTRRLWFACGMHFVQQVGPAHRARAVSWFTAMFDLGNTMANPLLGALAGWAGYTTMFDVSGLALLLTTAYIWQKPPSPGPT